jgi:hypothetical protein
MAAADPRAYRDHLRHATVLAFAWTMRDSAESPLVLARRHRRNVAALALDSAADERRAERPVEEIGSAAELQRIETKLNAVIELFAALVERDLVLPPLFPVRFNAHGIEWKTDRIPVADTPILVRIHLDSFPAMPLELAAITLSSLDTGWAAALFEPLRFPLAETIEKTVFREHRRQLADSIGTER